MNTNRYHIDTMPDCCDPGYAPDLITVIDRQGGVRIAMCESQEHAERIVNALNASVTNVTDNYTHSR